MERGPKDNKWNWYVVGLGGMIILVEKGGGSGTVKRGGGVGGVYHVKLK